MYQTPIKLNTENLKNFNFKDPDFDDHSSNMGYLSSRDYRLEPLQFTGTNHLQNLLAEMEALHIEMEQKMHTYKLFPDLKNNLNSRPLKSLNSQGKSYQVKVQGLESQISDLRKLYQQEEDEHEKEKVRVIQVKWREQVNLLKIEIGEQAEIEKQKERNRVGDKVLKENRKPGGQELRESKGFGKESKELGDMKEEVKRILREKQAVQEDVEMMEGEMEVLRGEVRRLREENRVLKERKIGVCNDAGDRYREIEGEKNRVVEENRCLKEKFSLYQEEQGRAIEQVTNEMNALVNLVNYIVSQKAQRT